MRAALETVQLDSSVSFACFRRIDSEFAFEWHFHPEYELVLITAGRGRRFVGDHIEDYREGDLVLMGPNLPHTWQSSVRRDPPVIHKAACVQFHRDCLGAGFFDLPEMQRVNLLLKRVSRGLRFVGPTARRAARIVASLPDRKGLDRVIGLLEAFDLLAVSKSTRVLAGAGYTPSLATGDSRRIDRVMRYVSEHFNQPVTQQEAARRAHMSPSSFSRFFKRVTGRTFIDYLNELRISEACRLLCETDLRVSEIAFRVGFSSLPYFNRRFRRVKGVTAREYRKTFPQPAERILPNRASDRSGVLVPAYSSGDSSSRI